MMLVKEIVVQCACGFGHTAAITRDGRLYTFGYRAHSSFACLSQSGWDGTGNLATAPRRTAPSRGSCLWAIDGLSTSAAASGTPRPLLVLPIVVFMPDYW